MRKPRKEWHSLFALGDTFYNDAYFKFEESLEAFEKWQAFQINNASILFAKVQIS